MSDPFEDPLHHAGAFDFSAQPVSQPSVKFTDPVVTESLDDIVAPVAAAPSREKVHASLDDAPGPAPSNGELKITVTEPTKRGEGMDTHVVYRVSTKVQLMLR